MKTDLGDASASATTSTSSSTGGKDSPAEEASILSKMFFEWMTSLIRLGGKRQLQQEDLWNLSKDNTTLAIGEDFNANWSQELSRFEAEKKR